MKSLDFKFGAGVYGRETRCGQLSRLAVEPDNWRLTDLVMESGLVFKQHTVVPVAEVEEATAMGIHLTVGCQELAGYPQFKEMVVEHREQSWVAPVQTGTIVGSTATALMPTAAEMALAQETIRQGIDDDKILLGDKVAVHGEDGRIGHLAHIITTNDVQPYQIEYLVVSEGTLLSRQYIVPIHYVHSLSEEGIYILADAEEIRQFPEFLVLPEDEDTLEEEANTIGR